MTDSVQIAIQRFAQGLNCSQAVFSAFAVRGGLSEEVASRIASPFGGGVARQGQVCGALTGALMALGLARDSDSPERKEEAYRIAEGFVTRFQERAGAILCRELIGYDISTQEGLQAARENQAFARVCPRLVEEAARLMMEHLPD
jgi:C_GCAxxG_C_C family probable redox protein